MPTLLTSFVRNTKRIGSPALLEHKIRSYTTWNLTQLDIENLKDEECIEALNDNFFEYYFKYDKASLEFDRMFTYV